MPNWAEGTIRIRGKFDKVVEFLSTELKPIQKNLENKDTVKCRVVKDEYGSVTVKVPPEDIYNPGEMWFYDSRRNFLFTDSVTIDEYFDDDEEHVFVFDKFNAAWDIDYDVFQKYASMYGIDIRLWVWECGLQFEHKVTFLRNGEIEDEGNSAKDSDEWLWNFANPLLGG